VTDATADFYRHYLGDANRGNLYYQTAVGSGHSLVVLQEPHVNGLNDCKDNDVRILTSAAMTRLESSCSTFTVRWTHPIEVSSRNDDALRPVCLHQTHDTGSLSLGDAGYVFVPKDCAEGGVCRVISLSTDETDVGDIGQRLSTTPGTIPGLIRTISSSSIRRPRRAVSAVQSASMLGW